MQNKIKSLWFKNYGIFQNVEINCPYMYSLFSLKKIFECVVFLRVLSYLLNHNKVTNKDVKF
ncbi:hypothetical protein C0J52_19827 [Blattella germanica]|nr:hypothetical protein C0J52_19827 [Blattella germanica]